MKRWWFNLNEEDKMQLMFALVTAILIALVWIFPMSENSC